MLLWNFKKVPGKRFIHSFIHSFIHQILKHLLWPGQKIGSNPKLGPNSSHVLAPVVGMGLVVRQATHRLPEGLAGMSSCLQSPAALRAGSEHKASL